MVWEPFFDRLIALREKERINEIKSGVLYKAEIDDAHRKNGVID